MNILQATIRALFFYSKEAHLTAHACVFRETPMTRQSALEVPVNRQRRSHTALVCLHNVAEHDLTDRSST